MSDMYPLSNYFLAEYPASFFEAYSFRRSDAAEDHLFLRKRGDWGRRRYLVVEQDNPDKLDRVTLMETRWRGPSKAIWSVNGTARLLEMQVGCFLAEVKDGSNPGRDEVGRLGAGTSLLVIILSLILLLCGGYAIDTDFYGPQEEEIKQRLAVFGLCIVVGVAIWLAFGDQIRKWNVWEPPK